MHKFLSGLALAALVAGAAQAKPGGGNGGGHGGGGDHGGGNPQAVMGGGGGPEQGRGNGGGHGHGGGGEMRAIQAAAPEGGRGNGHGHGNGGGGEMRQFQAGSPDGGRGNGHGHGNGGEWRQVRAEGPGGGHGNGHGGGQDHAMREAHEHQNGEVRNAARMQAKSDRHAERAFQKFERGNERAVIRANGAANNPRLVNDGFAPARFSGRGRAVVEGCPPGLAKKNNGCMPPGLARNGLNGAGAFTAAAGTGLLANSLTPTWFGYDDYGPDYRYYDGYLLRTNGDSVLGYVPLLGGALAPGRPWLTSFQPAPIPAYWNDYYDLGSVDRYRYYDNVLYQLDPGRSEIEDIVALMAGDPWGVGQPMPYGYDVYNVPYSYRASYYDTSDHWYRYSDGYVYDVDPTTRLVRSVVQLLGGGTPLPGQPWRASYQAAPIPAYWNDYYGLETPDRYRYYDDVIYELDDGRSEIDSIVAITAGDSWSVGDRMPYGYDVYNVPYAYRDRYYDQPDHLYRYSDGYVYDIDPTTRLVLAAVQLLA